jgi:hypothetical protein
MSSLLSLAALVARATKDDIYTKALALATALGLPVTSWSAGDPTRSLYHHTSEQLALLEDVVHVYIAAGHLELGLEAIANAPDEAARQRAIGWLKLGAKQVYGVDAVEATFATTSIVLTNAGGGLYELEPGDVTVKNGNSLKTYTSTTGGTLAPGPGTTLTLDVVADEAGSESTASPGEINELVTNLLGVTVANADAAVALDEERPESIVDRAKAKLGALSPNGPRDAYRYVALERKLTGPTNVTRARSIGDSTTGHVRLYLAGPAGPVSEPDRVAVEAAVVKWATPLTITPFVRVAQGVTVAVAYELWLYSSVNESAVEVATKVEAALRAMFSVRPISGDIIPPASSGALYRSLIKTTIQKTYGAFAFRVQLTTPDEDVPIAVNQVAVIGTVTDTIHFVRDP